ncbi:MAG: hypothetical protein CENE_00162 [Candidatus Celerinatantimonas neptuna]|nr:MAG: hypothetical protein CENE_00162 [Candidatus Celerinatantimonas neptuna]
MKIRAMKAISSLYLKSSLEYKANIIGSMISIFVYLTIFYFLWEYTYKFSDTHIINGFTIKEMMWYTFGAQLIVLSQPTVSSDLFQIIRDKEIENTKKLPVSTFGYIFLSHLFRILPIFVGNFVVGFIYITLLIGELPQWQNLIKFILLLPLSYILSFSIQVLIGCWAVKMKDVLTMEWLYSKMLLILGGGLIPITFFPGFLQGILTKLPFNFIIFVPSVILSGKINKLGIDNIFIFILSCVVLFLYSSRLLNRTA